jgi:hypothetical protein
MGKEQKLGMRVLQSISDNFIRERRMEKEDSNGKMAATIKVTLLMGSFKVSEFTTFRISIKLIKVNLE